MSAAEVASSASAPTPATASAVPGWLRENLPPYLASRPATVEMLWAVGVAVTHETGVAGLTFYGAASSIGADHWPLIAEYAQHFNWIPVIAGIVFPALRGHTAFRKAKTTATP